MGKLKPIEEMNYKELGDKPNPEPASTFHGQETLDKMKEYIASVKDRENWLPTAEGMSLFLEVTPSCLNKWAKRYLKVRHIYDQMMTIQKEKLQNAVVFGGKFANAGGGIFLLKANHQMVDSSRTLIGNADGSNIETLKIYKPEKNKE